MINTCLNINRINININPNISSNKRQGFFCNKKSCDTVSFCSNNILNKGSKAITKKVVNSVGNPKYFLGEGTDGLVYKLPNTDLCVKMSSISKCNGLGEWDLNISPKDRVNHIVAKSENGTVIMKRIEGIPLKIFGIPDEVYNLPKVAYKKLLKQLSDAHDKGMSFDPTPSNIIYNPKNKSLTAIDFIYAKEFEFEPFTLIYGTIKDYVKKSNNDKLSVKLLDVAADEIKNNFSSGIPVTKGDMISLLEYSKKSLSDESKKKWIEFNELYKQL